MSEHKKKKHKGEKKPKTAKRLDAPKVAKPKATKPNAKKVAAPTKRKEVTGLESVIHFEMISQRAYFISENRRSRGVHGDERGDWIEAERQLKEEAS